MQELSNLLGELAKRYHLAALGLGSARILALVSIAPFLGGRWIPGTAKVVVSLALAIACYPVISHGPAHTGGSLFLGLLLFKETLVGLSLGFAVSLVFKAAEAAGDAVEAARGSSMSQVLNPATREPSSPLGTLFALLAVTILFLSGGYLVVVKSLAESFRLVPVESIPSVGVKHVFREILYLSAAMLVLASAIAGPVLLAVVLADLGVGLISKAAPQLDSYFMALPLKASVALIVIAIGVSMTVTLLSEQAIEFISRAFGIFSP